MTVKQVGVGKKQGRSLKPSPCFLGTGGILLRPRKGLGRTRSSSQTVLKKGSFLKARWGRLLCYGASIAPARREWDLWPGRQWRGTLSPLPQAPLSDLSFNPGSRLQPLLGSAS